MKKIHYQLCNRANIGTEDNPVWHTSFVEKVISYSEDNLAIAQAEGYNGEYTIEEEGAAVMPNQLDRIEAQVTYTAMMTDTLLEE